MDLSGLKWPLIIAAIVGIGWLASSPGVSWMEANFTKSTPGADAERDKLDEAGLSRLATYVLYLWKYQKAKDLMTESIERYGENGANFWFNKYRISTCDDRLGNWQEAVDGLQELIDVDAHTKDDRIPEIDNLQLKMEKIKSVHELAGAM